MMDVKTRIRRLLAILTGLAGFLFIAWVAGPEVHLFETIGAILFGFATGFVAYKFLSFPMG